MVLILKRICQFYVNLTNEHKDPRVEGLPFLHSPFPVLAVIGIYLMFVLKCGPQFMKNREPYNLKMIMRVYNFILVICNTFLFVLTLPNSYMQKDFSLLCQPVDKTNHQPYMKNLILLSYGYYITKFIDLFDTVFFVLRKKNKQITFLHVYHHAGMVFGVYIYMKFFVGSHSTMLGLINCFVHTVMYGYYFLTSIRPELQKNMWWKKYITQIQLIQFGYLVFHYFVVLVWNTCKHPIFVTFMGIIQNFFMFILFFDFYLKAYVIKKKIV